jgi:hypothetical protein
MKLSMTLTAFLLALSATPAFAYTSFICKDSKNDQVKASFLWIDHDALQKAKVQLYLLSIDAPLMAGNVGGIRPAQARAAAADPAQSTPDWIVVTETDGNSFIQAALPAKAAKNPLDYVGKDLTVHLRTEYHDQIDDAKPSILVCRVSF